MPKNTIRFDDDKWYTQGRALKAFAAATVLGVAGWQFAKWWQNPIDHEAIKPFNDHVMIGNVKVSDPFAVMFNHMGVREGEGATLGTQTFAEALEKTTKLADQVDPRIQKREQAAIAILNSYKQFNQTGSTLQIRYEFLISATSSKGLDVYDPDSDGEKAIEVGKLLHKTARLHILALIEQAEKSPSLEIFDLIQKVAPNCFNRALEQGFEECMEIRQRAFNKQKEFKEQNIPTPE